MKFLSFLLTLLLLTSCAFNNLSKDDQRILNSSALYDPPSVTLLDGVEYQFLEGKVTGRGQKFFSQYEKTRRLVESFKKE